MSSRTRLIVVISITIIVLAVASGFTISRIVSWHMKGWVGAMYAPVFPGQKPATGPVTYGSQPGEILMTYGGSPADGRLLAKDVVVSINGVPITDLERLRELDASLPRDAQLLFRVNRGDRIIDVPLTFASPLRSPYLLIKTIVAFTVATTFVFVALLVIARRPDDRRVLVFFAFSLVSSVAILMSASAVYENAAGRGIVMTFGPGTFGSILGFLSSLAYASLILHLSLIFPRERPVVLKRPYLIRWIYAGALLAALILGVFALLFLVMMKSGSVDASWQFGVRTASLGWILVVAALFVALGVIWAGRREGIVHAFASRPLPAALALWGLYSGIFATLGQMGLRKVAAVAGAGSVILPLLIIGSYPVIACIAFVRSYRAAGVEEKKQVQWPLWGLVIALLAKIVALVISTGIGIALSIQHASMIEWRPLFNTLDIIPTIVTLAIPLSFSAAILKYRLMNIDVIIRKTVVYAMLSTLIIVLYLGVVGGLGSILVSAAGLKNQTMVIAATLVVALLFVPLRNRLQTLVDRNLFRHRYDYPEALRAITEASRDAADATLLLGIVAEKLQEALQNRSIVMFVERQDELVASAKVGVSDTLLGRLRVGSAFLGGFDRPFDPRRHPLPDDVASAAARLEAVLLVPTGARAFMALGSKLTRGDFDVDDIDFLRAAADQVAMALDRIRMQAEEEDFAQARAIQQTLLPRQLPRLSGIDVSGVWQPARTMGGDYYDVIELGSQQLAICIGDVAGKGMPAALLMSGLQAAVRATASDSPRDLCERVRRVVVSSLSGGRFVTFFYAVLDSAAMRLRWCNAGHNAPMLVRATGEIFRLEGGGPAFSRLFRDDRYEEREIALMPGDRLVLFTDGVSEATDASAELFGEGRIEELIATHRQLSATELQRTIVERAVAFAGGDLQDDLTLVVASVAG